jgi:hypothetical protein
MAMKFIVVRAIPFTPTQQRRRQRRPDSFHMIKDRAQSGGGGPIQIFARTVNSAQYASAILHVHP